MTKSIVPRDFSHLASGLIEQGSRRRYRKGTLLLQEGEGANTIFMVLAGSLKVFSQDFSVNREYIHDICGPGRIVGVVGLDGGPCEASAVTLEATECSVVGYRGFTEYLDAHPNYALELLTDALGDVRKARQKATTLALWDVYHRLAVFLTDEASNGALLKISHQAIADQIGASREMVGRLMRDLEMGGYIEKAGQSLLVRKALPSSW